MYNTNSNSYSRKALMLLITGMLLAILLTKANSEPVNAQSCATPPCINGEVEGGESPIPESWLERFNYYRSVAGLSPVVEDPAYLDALVKHVNYMLLNVPYEKLWHGETPDRPGYTPEGAQAAAESNIWFPGSDATAANAIDVWMGSMAHRYGMLHHDLVNTGFAMACDSQHCGIALNVLRGLAPGANQIPQGIVYPGTNQLYVNDDVIISWQFDPDPTVTLNNATLYDSSGKIVDVTTTAPPPGDYFNMVIMKLLTPLEVDATYTVEIYVTLGNRQLRRAWNFTNGASLIYIHLPLYVPLVVR